MAVLFEARRRVALIASDLPADGLSRRAARIVRAAAEAIFADRTADGRWIGPSDALCDRAVAWLRAATDASSGNLRFGIGALAWLLELLPIVIVGVPRRMTSLSIGERVDYFERLERHRVGLLSMLIVAFKVPLAIAAFEEGEGLAWTGFDRPDTAARRALPMAPRDAADASG